MECPKCHDTVKQHKIGKTGSGSQRYRRCLCRTSYTQEKKQHGYGDVLRQKALRYYVEGMNLRRIGRQLGSHHQTVANWVKAYAKKLPAAPVPREIKTAEMDVFMFIGEKKQDLHRNRRGS